MNLIFEASVVSLSPQESKNAFPSVSGLFWRLRSSVRAAAVARLQVTVADQTGAVVANATDPAKRGKREPYTYSRHLYRQYTQFRIAVGTL